MSHRRRPNARNCCVPASAGVGDASLKGLSLESRFDLTCNVAHALALAALRYRGYRSESRYLLCQCLQHTIDLPIEQWGVLDQARRKRNLAGYEGDMDVDEQLVEALMRVTREVAKRVKAMAVSWVRINCLDNGTFWSWQVRCALFLW